MASSDDIYDAGLKKGELLHNGRFEIIEELKKGGFGAVYSAKDIQNSEEK